MEHASQEFAISYLGVSLATLAAYFLGALWYSPILFYKKWLTLNGLTEEDIKTGGLKIMISTLILLLLAAFILAAFLGPSGLLFSMEAGLMVGLGWVGASLAILYLYERKPMQLFLINAGYLTLSFTIMGAIIGWFQA